ncbi:methylmalonate-semialdehyde dehydrogenase [Halomonas sp. KO116]|nr:methylmalonate-semialdehyde dehydrogenase [Halomonas sp. KO116]
MIDSSLTTVPHWIGGSPVEAARYFPVVDPAFGKTVRQVAMADTQTVNSAVKMALTAYPTWRDMPPSKRVQVMYRFKMLLERDAEALCKLISEEHGKVLEDAMGELKRGIENVEYACGIPELLKGEYSHNAGPGIDTWSNHQPVGIVAGITPFNFPTMVPLWMFPIAIACGNCFILKPSEQVPSVAIKMAELLEEAGLPAGVFSVVQGDREAADALIEHSKVKALSFVGSTPVAKAIYQRGASLGKRVQALGGAKNHAVILPDADLENAANTLIGAAYGSAGERCMAISVVVCVGNQTADVLVDKIAEKAKHLNIGPGTEPGLDMGALVNPAHRDRVADYIGQGESAGAVLRLDGRKHPLVENAPGYFMGATLFDHVTSAMRIYQDEIFGPVLCVVRVDDFDQAVELINAHQYGNGTCLFTRAGEAARRFTDEVEVGMVGINVPLPVPVAFHSFGGWKESLFGDLHAYGPDAVRFYTRRKAVLQRWPTESAQETAQFSFPSH